MNAENFLNHIRRIHLMNQAWKLAQARLGNDSPISQALRDQKACLQVSLLREYGREVWLQVDEESEEETLLSVRFAPGHASSLGGRVDADHIPARLAEELLTESELDGALK